MSVWYKNCFFFYSFSELIGLNKLANLYTHIYIKQLSVHDGFLFCTF